MSPQRTPYAVWCSGSANPPASIPCTNGIIFLTTEEYRKQMRDPDAKWKCPICGSNAIWDDENYEQAMEV